MRRVCLAWSLRLFQYLKTMPRTMRKTCSNKLYNELEFSYIFIKIVYDCRRRRLCRWFLSSMRITHTAIAMKLLFPDASHISIEHENETSLTAVRTHVRTHIVDMNMLTGLSVAHRNKWCLCLVCISWTNYTADISGTLTVRSINLHGTKIVSSITLTVFTNFSIKLTMLSRENSVSSFVAIRLNEFLRKTKKRVKMRELILVLASAIKFFNKLMA